MWTSASLMDFSQSALFFWPLFPVFNFASINISTHFPHLFLGHPISWLPWGLLLNTRLTFPLLSILLTWLNQFKGLIMTNENISKSPNSCITSFYCCLQLSITLFPQTFFLKLFYQNLQPFSKIFIHSPRLCSVYCHWSCLIDYFSCSEYCLTLTRGRSV